MKTPEFSKSRDSKAVNAIEFRISNSFLLNESQLRERIKWFYCRKETQKTIGMPHWLNQKVKIWNHDFQNNLNQRDCLSLKFHSNSGWIFLQAQNKALELRINFLLKLKRLKISLENQNRIAHFFCRRLRLSRANSEAKRLRMGIINHQDDPEVQKKRKRKRRDPENFKLYRI